MPVGRKGRLSGVKIHRTSLYFIVFLLFIPIIPSVLAEPSADEPYGDRIDTFFQSLIKGEIEKSFRNLVSRSLIQSKPQELLFLIRQIKNALSIYGEILDYKHLDTRCLSERLCLTRYLSFSKNYPILWNFIFYKGQDEWVLLHVSFNDSVKLFFDLK